jgi:2-isopropylmalate synthase
MVRILDATLREGEQTPGVCFDPHIKLAVAQLLDEVGVDIIEGGHPAVASEIKQVVKTLAGKDLRATVSAHSRSTESDLALALECGVGFLGIFYCVSDERLNGVHRKDLGTAVEHITRAIRYAKQRSPDLVVRYTPEDTVRSAFGNVVEASVAAVRAGADVISVADTTGYMIPGTKNNMYDFIRRLQKAFDEAGVHPKLAVHCHNDRGLALANALDAYRAGVDIIDACVLGLGERSGIVDLAQLLTVLKADFEEGAGWNLAKLPELYELVSAHSGVPVPVTFPVVGENAFTHCAGVHTQAAIQNPIHYQSLAPALVGRKMKISLDHMSGMASVRYALEQAGIRGLDEELERAVLNRVKTIGRTGRTVEASELPYIVEWCRKQAGGSDGNAG